MQPLAEVPLRSKTTMRIGGTAEYFCELSSRADAEEAYAFATKEGLPLVLLGSGSNTIFADGVIRAVVAQVTHAAVDVQGNTVRVGAGKNLAMLINEVAAKGLDLSPLTGIPGSIGGAIFGNAGQGPSGIWFDRFVESVTAFVDGTWTTFPRDACAFRYRESMFKDLTDHPSSRGAPRIQPIIWEVVLTVPSGDPGAIAANVQTLLKRRIETQPHARTAGSCFKAVGSVPAWRLIDAAGLRGHAIGDVAISTKHANFLISGKAPTFADTLSLISDVRTKIPEGLEVEMRCVGEDGRVTQAHSQNPMPQMGKG